MLVNVVVNVPNGSVPPILAEVQLHLKEVVLLKESVLHRLYEVTRAPSIDSLIAETDLGEDEKVRAETDLSLYASGRTHEEESSSDTHGGNPLHATPAVARSASGQRGEQIQPSASDKPSARLSSIELREKATVVV